ncbi:hypothetical protein O6P43_002955 [Quillaja saponaria]|uniref:DUF3615 domain-containing protein n=1 Tax=Quillaja saponaria TaxID=32244 RepID=A0AAD7VKZ9_QUISA|nr:hypothetical protein O6P43_002955 [Quillaja saponaria]
MTGKGRGRRCESKNRKKHGDKPNRDHRSKEEGARRDGGEQGEKAARSGPQNGVKYLQAKKEKEHACHFPGKGALPRTVYKIPEMDSVCSSDLEDLVTDDFPESMELYCEGAKDAMAHFNKQMSSNFEFVKLVGFRPYRSWTLWLHINFEAKHRSIDWTCSSPKLFFAELQLNVEEAKFNVRICSMLDLEGCGDGVGVADNIFCVCFFCWSDIKHPADFKSTITWGPPSPDHSGESGSESVDCTVDFVSKPGMWHYLDADGDDDNY